MTRSLAWLLALVLTVPAFGAAGSGSISGFVKDTAGTPQIGAVVQIFTGATLPALTVFTDARGFYAAAGLTPGNYGVKVTATSFLPSLRENVALRSGANLIVNVTLNTLFEAMQLIPAKRNSVETEEDWKWTLRSMTNRPVLRVVDDGPLVVVSRSENSDDRVLKARVAFLAGSEAESVGGTTAFNLEAPVFSFGRVYFNGNVGYDGQKSPTTVVSTTYKHELPNGSTPQTTISFRRFSLADGVSRDAALQVLALSLSDNFNLFGFADVTLGSEYDAVQLAGAATAFKPFARFNAHVSRNTLLSYRYATSVPQRSGPVDENLALADSGPRMSLVGFNPVLEKGQHHEVAIARRIGSRNTVEFAVYHDSVSNPMLNGVGDVPAADLLPQLYSGVFAATGRDFQTNGLRLVTQHKFHRKLTATVDYAYGGALEVPAGSQLDNVEDNARVRREHAVSGRIGGEMPGSRTRWSASYTWSSGRPVSLIDMFNASPGRTDPHLNLFLRQPMPTLGFLPSHMEALVDVRNLLAQGYVPVVGNDGRTLYLVQTARSVRGGVSFSF